MGPNVLYTSIYAVCKRYEYNNDINLFPPRINMVSLARDSIILYLESFFAERRGCVIIGSYTALDVKLQIIKNIRPFGPKPKELKIREKRVASATHRRERHMSR
jgi:hypothetical protein